MRRDLIIIENFYEDPDAVVRYAMSLKYCTPFNEPDDAAKGIPARWRTSWFQEADKCPFKASSGLIAKLEFLTGEKIDIDYWSRSFPLGNDGRPRPGYESVPRTAWWNCCFHVKHWVQEFGSNIHNHDYFDSWSPAGPSGWAGIVYLSKDAPIEGGLTTWRNRHGRRHDHYTPVENWEHLDTIANVYNRLVLHRGTIPHAGQPGWGSTLEDGRIFQTFFFSTLAPLETSAVTPLELQMPLPMMTRD